MNKLKEACIISHEHWTNDIEKTIKNNNIEIPSIEMPNKDNITQISDKNRHQKKTLRSPVIKIILVAAILFTLLLSVCAFSPFKDFVVEFFDDYNLFTNSISETYYPKGIEITNLPEDFIMIEEEINSLNMFQKYECGEKSFIILKSTPNTSHQISNTYSDVVVFYNKNIKYSLYELTDETTEIIWLTDKYLYIMLGYNLTNEEMIKIAKNIE